MDGAADKNPADPCAIGAFAGRRRVDMATFEWEVLCRHFCSRCAVRRRRSVDNRQVCEGNVLILRFDCYAAGSIGDIVNDSLLRPRQLRPAFPAAFSFRQRAEYVPFVSSSSLRAHGDSTTRLIILSAWCRHRQAQAFHIAGSFLLSRRNMRKILVKGKIHDIIK